MFVFSTFSSFSNSNYHDRITVPVACAWLRWPGRLPPGAVVRVPLDGLLQALLEVRVRRLPAEISPQLGGVDRIAAVVARTVPSPVERVRILAHHGRDVARNTVMLLRSPFAPIRYVSPKRPLGRDGPHAGGVVVRVDPVTHVLPVAVQLRLQPLEGCS